ncbi:MAG TPA: hypothetical protein PKW35_03235 [Nannocystaceae bacterium]|nr:hypothetical protein [Nannocystaceae bacterium]
MPTAEETFEPLPPPPPWGEESGARDLASLVSAALRPPAVDEVQIDVDDLDAPSPRLVELLYRRFRGDGTRVRAALGQLRGRFQCLADYVDTVLAAEGVPAWVLPYVDVDTLGSEWCKTGLIWVVDDAGDDEHDAGLYVFRG